MSSAPSKTILFEMLRSFTVLARTLNLSKATVELNSTRQTVRRHIDILEEIRGEALFEVHDRQYYLTEAGARSLKEAQNIVARGEVWMSGVSTSVRGLTRVSFEDSKTNHVFYAQQHAISRLWINSSPMMQQGFHSWATGKTALESPEMAVIRPYLVVYRRMDKGWLCVEIGEKSSYASWFGWTWAKSSIGRMMLETPAGEDFAHFISQAYLDVYEGSGVRLDHIFTHIPRQLDGEPVPVAFQRLLMGCTFPDGEFALAVLVDRTYQIEIAGLKEDKVKLMPREFLMEFDISI